jgi:NAD(P)H-flavin reductase
VTGALAELRRSVLPHAGRIAACHVESDDTRTFVIRLDEPVSALDAARPGQFVMLSLLGHGEAAFTLAALPSCGAAAGTVTVTVRQVGALTAALFALAPGARVGVRGPYGRGFPLDGIDRPTLYVGGGCGLVPLKAAVDHQLVHRTPGTSIAIVYGARMPRTRVLRDALAAWAREPAVTLIETVERAEPGWDGRVGSVLAPVEEAVRAIGAERAAFCGPAGMLAPVGARLLRCGLAPDAVFVALERYMKCGTGLCGHCYVNARYVCTDGPVFSLAELAASPEAFDPPADSHAQS